jgi:hypothetical protein
MTLRVYKFVLQLSFFNSCFIQSITLTAAYLSYE